MVTKWSPDSRQPTEGASSSGLLFRRPELRGFQVRVVGPRNSTLDTGLKFVLSSEVRVLSLLIPRPRSRSRPRSTGRETFWSGPSDIGQLYGVENGVPQGFGP